MAPEIVVDIRERLGVLRTNELGWSKELNIVSWNGGPYKYDIREWSPDHERMSRGITLTEAEMQILAQAYSQSKVNLAK